MRPWWQSADDKRDRLSQVSVLLVERDPHLREQMHAVLYGFGFRSLHIAESQKEALYVIRTHAIELMITAAMRTVDIAEATQLIEAVRQAEGDMPTRRDIPAIMVTHQPQKQDVLAARDAGISEFMATPLEAKALSQRIIRAVDTPRVFVDSAVFTGPCRRRRPPPLWGIERRRKLPIEPIQTELSDTMTPVVSERDVTVFAANTQIRSQLGEELTAAEILTDSVIAQAQDLLDQARDGWSDSAHSEIQKLEETLNELMTRPTDVILHHLLLVSASSLMVQARSFGYGLGEQVAGMLSRYIQRTPMFNGNQQLVVRTHIDVIRAVFTNHLSEQVRMRGAELIRSLEALTTRMG